MKRILPVIAFIIFSFIVVDNAPAPPLPGAQSVPVGGAMPGAMVIAAIAAYGIWRMRK